MAKRCEACKCWRSRTYGCNDCGRRLCGRCSYPGRESGRVCCYPGSACGERRILHRRATALMRLPRCKDHGEMALRPISRQSPEQKFCGVWYDCPQCQCCVLFTSAELQRQLAEQAKGAR